MTSFTPLLAGAGTSFCIVSALLLYNVVVLVQQLRSKSEEKASGLAKAAWGVSVLSLFLGPCGWVTGLVALVMAHIERGRAYRGDSSMGSIPAARIASLNSVFAILLTLVIGASALVQWLPGGDG